MKLLFAQYLKRILYRLWLAKPVDNLAKLISLKLLIGTASFFFLCWLIALDGPAFSGEIQAKLENDNFADKNTPDLLSQSTAPASLIGLGDYAIIVEKSSQKLYLYDGDYKLIKTFHVTTGQRQGNKTAQGDRKTPEGIYFFTLVKDDRELLPEYGVMALPINYPNFIDAISHKNGNGIWLHATNQPTRPLKPYDTRGCVVAANEDIVELAEYIKLQTTPMVIVDKIEHDSLEKIKATRQEIDRFIEKWQTSWEEKDLENYMDSYSKSFRTNGMDWLGWKKYKNTLNHQYSYINVSLSDIRILRHTNHVVASFIQRYKNNNLASVGIKRLYLIKENERWEIIGEEWAPLPTQKPSNIAQRYAAYRKPTLAKGETSSEQNSINNLYVQQAKFESQAPSHLSLAKTDRLPQTTQSFVNPVRSSAVSINKNSSSTEEASKGVNGHPPQQYQEESASPSKAAAIDIEDFTIDGGNSANKVKFKLVNKIGERYKISGRLAIIAENKGDNEVRYSTYPPMTIKQGVPKDFRKGEWFSIRRFKIVKGGFEEKGADIVTVLVYSKEGDLLLNKKFPIQTKQ